MTQAEKFHDLVDQAISDSREPCPVATCMEIAGEVGPFTGETYKEYANTFLRITWADGSLVVIGLDELH